VVEEPVPGVVVVSECEAVRVASPDSDDEDKGLFDFQYATDLANLG
jgi:hypothetical protein